jgi:hypothetical protein
MSISRFVFLAAIIGSCELVFPVPLHSQVPDCTKFKQEESYSKAPIKPIVPASKLLHFCNPSRITGQFVVKIKDNDDLAKDVPPAVADKLDVLPGLVPDNKEKCTAFGRVIAEKYRSRFTANFANFCSDNFRFFSVQGISDVDAAAMAQDPRIEYMEPNLRATVQ